MLILHGENAITSRERLVTELQKAKTAGVEIVRVESKKTTLAELEQALGSASLFGTEKLVIIEKTFSLPRSKKKNELLDFLSKFQDQPVILWEVKALTKTQLKKFSNSQTQEFKVSKVLFKWLESLSGSAKNKTNQTKLLQQAVAQENEHICFSMLCRQVRLLIQAKEGEPISGPPFMQAKLKSQANTFQLQQLLQLHRKLLELDVKMKSSQLVLPLAAELDLLLLSV